MPSFENTSRLSPLPIVDLREVSQPSDGFSVPLTDSCKSNFSKGDKCRDHYSELSKLLVLKPNQIIQCPFGFSSFPFRAGESANALTGFIPYPREGGAPERNLAKRYKDHRVPVTSVAKIANGLTNMEENVRSLEDQTVKKHSLAFHEIRKLNRQVNQTAERICREASPSDPESADPRIVTIWKTAELMSNQFEVMELLANESLASLPLNLVTEPYKLFDKCIRVYRVPADKHRFKMSSPSGYHPRVKTCDKTFPIIPTVLIQNAIKYSTRDSEIRVNIEPSGDLCKITVASVSNGQEILDDRIFERGIRGASELEGSGNGLYLAQLVARQHGTRLIVSSMIVTSNSVRHAFTLSLQTIQ